MTPFVIEDMSGEVVYSGQAELLGDQDIVVTSSVGSARHHVDNKSPLVKILLPFRDIEDFTPPDDPGQMTFMVETADSARERTDEEEENNRVGGTIKPTGGYPSPAVETEAVTVNTKPTQEEIEAAQEAEQAALESGEPEPREEEAALDLS